MRNDRLGESPAGIKIAERNINNLRYTDKYHCNDRKGRGTKEHLDENKREEHAFIHEIMLTYSCAKQDLHDWCLEYNL